VSIDVEGLEAEAEVEGNQLVLDNESDEHCLNDISGNVIKNDCVIETDSGLSADMEQLINKSEMAIMSAELVVDEVLAETARNMTGEAKDECLNSSLASIIDNNNDRNHTDTFDENAMHHSLENADKVVDNDTVKQESDGYNTPTKASPLSASCSLGEPNLRPLALLLSKVTALAKSSVSSCSMAPNGSEIHSIMGADADNERILEIMLKKDQCDASIAQVDDVNDDNTSTSVTHISSLTSNTAAALSPTTSQSQPQVCISPYSPASIQSDRKVIAAASTRNKPAPTKRIIFQELALPLVAASAAQSNNSLLIESRGVSKLSVEKKANRKLKRKLLRETAGLNGAQDENSRHNFEEVAVNDDGAVANATNSEHIENGSFSNAKNAGSSIPNEVADDSDSDSDRPSSDSEIEYEVRRGYPSREVSPMIDFRLAVLPRKHTQKNSKSRYHKTKRRRNQGEKGTIDTNESSNNYNSVFNGFDARSGPDRVIKVRIKGGWINKCLLYANESVLSCWEKVDNACHLLLVCHHFFTK
jgi:hypothetical protein